MSANGSIAIHSSTNSLNQTETCFFFLIRLFERYNLSIPVGFTPYIARNIIIIHYASEVRSFFPFILMFTKNRIECTGQWYASHLTSTATVPARFTPLSYSIYVSERNFGLYLIYMSWLQTQILYNQKIFWKNIYDFEG